MSSSTFLFRNLGNLGLGYAIAIALCFLVLLSTLLLASYVCCRSRPPVLPRHAPSLPSIIFVTDDDDDDGPPDRSPSPSRGLDPAIINSYPKFAFSDEKGGEAACAICLGEYKVGEALRMMPECRHYFHVPCLDAWLRLNASCPVCRSSPMPTPIPTPLSELVPLSQFPAGRRQS
ncbi:RING-H2 finger protein ATL67-like [Dioscorea cayenensis subsp. rotundata]|uniref:RING-H2 finger protein ATL67-like n=1 Tax=Dioscorea cayennensis subsp. rotundata TaxID=55577 RepID=A0AB40ALC1_DIOCR|nr:RING-H2 finger protein ATL67-like [Dioscorea cayenensis subsp. rotundata]